MSAKQMEPQLRQRLALELGTWLADGLISAQVHELLRQRYLAHELGRGQARQALTVAGGLFLMFGLGGALGAASGSLLGAGLVLALLGAGAMRVGVGLARDPLVRHVASASVVVAIGAFAFGLGVCALAVGSGVPDEGVLFTTGVVLVPAFAIGAYVYRNALLLCAALLAAMHWVGSFASMAGRATYVLEVQEPRLMIFAALLLVALGVWHELALRERTGRFYQVYQVVGLLYLNLSLLLLTIDGSGQEPWWIAAWLAVGLGQLVAGARLHSGLLTGFGVVALAINGYTRFFEASLERWPAGLPFLVGGVLGLLVGAACEVAASRSSQVPSGEHRNRAVGAEIDQLVALGMLEPEQAHALHQRYPERMWNALVLVRWLSIFGAVSVAAGALLLANHWLAALRVGQLALALATGGALVLARWLSARKGMPRTAAALELLASLALQGLVSLVAIELSSDSGRWPALLGLHSALALGLAYLLRNRLILIHATCCFFVFFGAQTGYASGWGMYWLSMTYPLRFLALSLVVLGVAYLHAVRLRGALQSFSRVYAHAGLLALSLSLWFLSVFGVFGESVPWDDTAGERLAFSALWALVSVGCVWLAGAIGQRILRAYGLTFLILNLYTFYFQFVVVHTGEGWWLHLLLVGGSLVAIGIKLERQLRERGPSMPEARVVS